MSPERGEDAKEELPLEHQRDCAVMETVHGKLFLDMPGDEVVRALREAGFWEPHVGLCLTRLFRRPLLQQAAFVDCGAHIGVHSLTAAQLHGCGAVVAVEMMAETHGRLLRNLALNPVAAGKIRPVRAVLSDVTGVLVRVSAGSASSPRNTGMARVVVGPPDPAVSLPVTSDIPTSTLDEILEIELPNTAVGVLKLDVEGHELAVLQGASATVRRWKPFIIMEVWGDSAASSHGLPLSRRDQIFAEVEAMGYAPPHQLSASHCDFLFAPQK